MNCRHCSAELQRSFVDLGSAPASNAYLTEDKLKAPEKWFPLRVLVCESCWLVQTEDFTAADELFDADYAYFSSYSTSWVRHAEKYVEAMTARLGLGAKSHVVEVASNDGYLLQHVKARGIPCLGIEPTKGTADAARSKGIEVIEEFFGVALGRKLTAAGKGADLTAANNVLAHVPDINDFVGGFAALLKPDGVSTFEFPHLMRLVENVQFDTIYHEHFSYLSLLAVDAVFADNGLSVFDVEEHPTHGGSLRVFAQRSDTGKRPRSEAVTEMLARERAAGVNTVAYYAGFQARVDRVKDAFVQLLLDAKRRGQSVAAYGAAAKGNTLMNYAGVRPDLVSFVVDLNPAKQGKYMPGSRVPIVDEATLQNEKPDLIVIFPWNLAKEIRNQLGYVRDWGAQFVTAVPQLEIF